MTAWSIGLVILLLVGCVFFAVWRRKEIQPARGHAHQPARAAANDRAADPAHDPAFDALTKDMAALAHKFLSENGAFSPFGGGVGPDGRVVSIALDPVIPNWEASTEDQIDAIASQIDIGSFDIGMVVADVGLIPPGKHEKTDAVLLTFESRSGFALNSYLPYSITKAEGLHYGEGFHSKASKKIFLGRTREQVDQRQTGYRYLYLPMSSVRDLHKN